MIQKIVYFRSFDFVQILPACNPNTYQVMYGDSLNFQYQHLQQKHGKIFTVNLLISRSGILFYAIGDDDIGSLISPHTLFCKYLDHMLVKFEQNCMVQTVENFELSRKKWLYNHFGESFGRHLCDINNYCCQLNIN